MEYQEQKPFEGIWKPHAVNKSSWMMKKMGKTERMKVMMKMNWMHHFEIFETFSIEGSFRLKSNTQTFELIFWVWADTDWAASTLATDHHTDLLSRALMMIIGNYLARRLSIWSYTETSEKNSGFHSEDKGYLNWKHWNLTCRSKV